MKFTITHRYPLGIVRTSECGNYEIWSAKPGSGHMLRSPDDPYRYVVSVVEGDTVRMVHRTFKLVYAKSFCVQHAKGKV